jgi:hypothetical protein
LIQPVHSGEIPNVYDLKRHTFFLLSSESSLFQPTPRTTKVRLCNADIWEDVNCAMIFSFTIFFIITEEMLGEVVVPPSKKLEDLIRLSELCVDLLRGNEEFYAEVSIMDDRRLIWRRSVLY